MKKKLALSVLPVLMLLTPFAAKADVCPDPSAIVWQNNAWMTKDGQYYGVTEYSAGQNTPATTLNYSFYRDASPAGTVICVYHTSDATKEIDMMHYSWTIQKPTASNWQPMAAPGWHGNAGLSCSGAGCSFVVAN